MTKPEVYVVNKDDVNSSYCRKITQKEDHGGSGFSEWGNVHYIMVRANSRSQIPVKHIILNYIFFKRLGVGSLFSHFQREIIIDNLLNVKVIEKRLVLLVIDLGYVMIKGTEFIRCSQKFYNGR